MGVLRATGPTTTEGEATATGTPVGQVRGPLPSLAGMMTATVRTKPQQKASNEPPTIPPITRVSLDLDFMLYLRRLPTDNSAAPMRIRSRTARRTARKTMAKLTGGSSVPVTCPVRTLTGCALAARLLYVAAPEGLAGNSGASLRVSTLG
jgi:hypothetical protein